MKYSFINYGKQLCYNAELCPMAGFTLGWSGEFYLLLQIQILTFTCLDVGRETGKGREERRERGWPMELTQSPPIR